MTPHHEEVAGGSSRPDLARFLCSQLWIEPSGMTLSVVSALARLNLDPPREAFRLATLPRTTAALMFAQTISRLPDRPATIDVAGTAARLIKLLPDVVASAAPGDGARLQLPRTWWIRALRTWQLWVILVLAALVIYLTLAGAPLKTVAREQPVDDRSRPDALALLRPHAAGDLRPTGIATAQSPLSGS